MPLDIIDTHAHLDMPHFDNDREAVVKRAKEAGVNTIISAGIDLDSSHQVVKLTERFSGILAAVGFHPQEAGQMKHEDIKHLAELAKHKNVVAIGEIGLDYYRDTALRETQLQVFRWQLELADTLDLPVVIHCRQAEKDMLAILQNWAAASKSGRSRVGIIHCFGGDIKTACIYLGLGFYISVGAYIGYPSSSLNDVIRTIPQDRLLIETDSPYLPPQSHRGKRNEPAYLPMTLAVLARIKGERPETLARQTTENATRIFRRLD